MKTTLVVTLLLLASIGSSHAQSLQGAAISAGAARLDNGSIVNIGQPFVGMMSSAGGSVDVGLIPILRKPLPPKEPPILGGLFIDSSLFRLTLSSRPGCRYILQASTNLLDWVPLVTKPGTGLALTLEDADLATFEHRFYRVGVE